MNELSLHILDIVQNSIKANSTLVKIIINEDHQNDLYTISIIDNGYGMDSKTLSEVADPFFTTRMEAAAALYHAGKVRHILVSGDNSTNNYNEPRDMRKKLLNLGVPKEAITMDFAGLRTLDSVIRSKEIFQQRKIIIVSQAFHNYRAIFIAQYHGIDAIAFNAEYPAAATSKTLWREFFARPKAILDLYFLGTQPKFLGKKIDIRV